MLCEAPPESIRKQGFAQQKGVIYISLLIGLHPLRAVGRNEPQASAATPQPPQRNKSTHTKPLVRVALWPMRHGGKHLYGEDGQQWMPYAVPTRMPSCTALASLGENGRHLLHVEQRETNCIPLRNASGASQSEFHETAPRKAGKATGKKAASRNRNECRPLPLSR